jgi:hypothetical protein
MNFENYKKGFDKPTIIMGEQYGTKISVQIDHSDTELDEIMDAFETIVICLGYHSNSWKQWILDRADEYRETDAEELKEKLDAWKFEDDDDFFADWDEQRMDVIGQNGNEGLHYDEEGVDELLKRYNEPETQKRLRAFRDEELEKLRHEGYRATEEDEDEFDDYGQRIEKDRVGFEWGDEPEDDNLFEGDELEANENLKAANERYKSEVKKMKSKKKKDKK